MSDESLLDEVISAPISFLTHHPRYLNKWPCRTRRRIVTPTGVISPHFSENVSYPHESMSCRHWMYLVAGVVDGDPGKGDYW